MIEDDGLDLDRDLENSPIAAQTTEEQEELIRLDFERFFQFVHQIILPFESQQFKAHASFHVKLMATSCRDQSATAAARGSLKSSILARYRPLYRLVDPLPGTVPFGKVEGLTVSETSSLSRKHLEWIKMHLTKNPYLLRRYGHLADPNNHTWNEDEIELKNGFKWYALGYESQIRGSHPTDLIVDDLESLKNMGTEESYLKLENWFFRVLLGAMIPETRVTVIGTIIARRSLLSKLVADPSWHGRVWKALDKNPRTGEMASLWPERWSIPWLIRRRKQIGLHAFNAEYQNEPLGLGDPIVRPEWIRHHRPQDLNFKPVRIYITLDPAFTEERWGDDSALIVFYEKADGMMMERMAVKKKVALPELRDMFIGVAEAMERVVGPNMVVMGIEEVAAQKAVRQAIMDKNYAIGSRIIPLHPDKDKARRLIDVSRHFEHGMVSIMTPGVEDEIVEFPFGNKDRTDAIVYALKLYERYHAAVPTGTAEEVDFMDKVDKNVGEMVMELLQDGAPNIHVSQKRLQQYLNAQRIAEELEGIL